MAVQRSCLHFLTTVNPRLGGGSARRGGMCGRGGEEMPVEGATKVTAWFEFETVEGGLSFWKF